MRESRRESLRWGRTMKKRKQIHSAVVNLSIRQYLAWLLSIQQTLCAKQYRAHFPFCVCKPHSSTKNFGWLEWHAIDPANTMKNVALYRTTNAVCAFTTLLVSCYTRSNSRERGGTTTSELPLFTVEASWVIKNMSSLCNGSVVVG